MVCGKRGILFAVLLLVLQPAGAWGCYAVIVGRQASADGSVLLGHLEQNSGRRVLVFHHIPRQQFPIPSVVRLRRGGQLPQVAQTGAMLWSEIPEQEFSDAYLNEWGVAIVSDACPSREENYAALVQRGDIRDGGIGYMFRRLVAQRAHTAREGVELAGQLLDRFGYVDSGRTYVIADPHEAWLLAVVRGRSWLAQRVPDDAVVLLPNVYITAEVDLADRTHVLASPRLVDYAVGRGWLDSSARQHFHFAQTFAARRDLGPDPRQWCGQQLLTAGREAWPPKQPLPWSIKPARKVSLADVMAVLRHTECVSIFTPKAQEGAVFQLRDGRPPAIGCVYWRTTAEPAVSVFTPWYAGITETPASYCPSRNVQKSLTLESHFNPPPATLEPDPRLAWWTFKNLQDLVHQDDAVRLPRVRSTWEAMERQILARQEAIEAEARSLWDRDPAAARALLTRTCAELAAGASQKAEELSAEFQKVPSKTVILPVGETLLNDIGTAQVFWQSYGKKPVAMPLGWTGHFDGPTGISYQDAGFLLGRRALLMHSPWRVPPGKTWADYRLTLPTVKPLELSFGIAMGPETVGPDKSDGVTFSCYLLADGREQQLMRQHTLEARWRDYHFDLSAHAGKTIVLRLQVEPGPRNDPSFDLSYFGDAKIRAGSTATNRAELLRRLTSTKSYQATAGVSLTGLSNNPSHGILPGNLQIHSSWRDSPKGKKLLYFFKYEGPDAKVVYTLQPTNGTLDDLTVQVNDGPPFSPAAGGGITAVIRRNGKTEEVPLTGGQSPGVGADKDSMKITWEYPLSGRSLPVEWTFRLVGKALAITVQCDDPSISRFSLGQLGPVSLRRSFSVPYLPGQISYLPTQNVFVGRYLDWTVSHSSHCPQGNAVYEPKTDGTRNTLFESGYVAVSSDFNEVLPNIPHPPSPYLKTLGPRIMLDVWGHHQGTYRGDADNLLALKDHGVDHLVLIQHDWQRYGYDVKLPDHIPANPSYGGDNGMKFFGETANRCGYLWSVHENYIDLYPDAPSYDPRARVLNSDGSPSRAWYNPGTKVQSFGLKCNRALDYAKQNAPEIHRRFGTTAAYLDVHTCVPPWHQLDHEASQPLAAMALAKVQSDTALFQYMRDTHHGPLFGEGFNHFYWAGRCDGVEAQVEQGEDHTPLLDFDLLKIHPQMVNHGMGYYERRFCAGYSHRWGYDSGSMEQIDKYRAQELAYGHAGFIGAAQVDNIPWVVREHHLMHPVQRLYGTAKPTEIRYEVDGQLVPAGVALVVGDTRRQRIRYDSGLTLWVNWRPEPWQVEGHTLPQWGFLALGPDTKVFTAQLSGKLADYAECPEYVFADARTLAHVPGGPPVKDIEPRLRSLEYVGDNRARVVYEWRVNDTLEEDYHCFVHGVVPHSSESDSIAFQQDHVLPRPTNRWSKGEVIVDGPHILTLPAKQEMYDLVVGLYKGERVPLKGIEESNHRIFLGRLHLQRQDGKITGIRLEKPSPAHYPQRTTADFTAHLNSVGTWIDFGKVGTDSSVKVECAADHLVVFPYPRNKGFRVSLDVKALAPGADLERLNVHALAAGTQKDLGPVDFKKDGHRLLLTVGKPGVGRYLISWK